MSVMKNVAFLSMMFVKLLIEMFFALFLNPCSRINLARGFHPNVDVILMVKI